MDYHIPSYPKIYNLGHDAVAPLLGVRVRAEEKVDGSQFSFCVHEGVPHVRSRGRDFPVDAPDKLFSGACDTVVDLLPRLDEELIYRGEAFQKPKHNTLAYGRIPDRHIALFDVQRKNGGAMPRAFVAHEASRLGLEVVPMLHLFTLTDPEHIRALLDRESFLGGQKIEGVVLKQEVPTEDVRYGVDGKVLMAKFVSEAFKETNKTEFRKANPTQSDILETIGQAYRTTARWEKAIQHLRDDGRLENSPRDIGNLIKEVQRDVMEECEDEIKGRLWAFAKGHVMRRVAAGLPEWYKQHLLDRQFGGAAEGDAGAMK